MRIIYFFIALALLASCGEKTSSSDGGGDMDWMFRGDASLSGYTAARLPDKPVLLWTYKSEARTSSSPIITGGQTFWSDKRGLIRGVSIDGELCFEYDLKTAVEATPMIHDSTLYVGRIDGYMTAISIPQRQLLWEYETMGQLSASAAMMEFSGHEAVVFGSYDNYLYCMDATKGEVLRRFETGYYLNGAAAVHKGHIIFGGCDAWVRIIDCNTGVQTDSLLAEDYIPASPAIRGDCAYIGDHSGNIYQLELEKGKIMRHEKIASGDSKSASFVSVPAVSDKAAYFYSGDRHIQCKDHKNRNKDWKYMLKGNVGESAPVISGDKVLVCTKTGIVSILNAKTGELLWEYDTGEQIVGSPAVIKGHFMILTAKGTLFCFGD